MVSYDYRWDLGTKAKKMDSIAMNCIYMQIQAEYNEFIILFAGSMSFKYVL